MVEQGTAPVWQAVKSRGSGKVRVPGSQQEARNGIDALKLDKPAGEVGRQRCCRDGPKRDKFASQKVLSCNRLVYLWSRR